MPEWNPNVKPPRRRHASHSPRSRHLDNRVSRLAKLRLARGYTVTELSVRAGVNTVTLGKLERGDVQRMKLETIIRVAIALDVAPVDLIPALAYRPRLKAAAKSQRIAKGERIAETKRPSEDSGPGAVATDHDEGGSLATRAHLERGGRNRREDAGERVENDEERPSDGAQGGTGA